MIQLCNKKKEIPVGPKLVQIVDFKRKSNVWFLFSKVIWNIAFTFSFPQNNFKNSDFLIKVEEVKHDSNEEGKYFDSKNLLN